MEVSALLLLLTVSSGLAALPKGWQACRRSAQDYDQCMLREITKAVKSLMNGDKSFGVLPLDPITIEKMKLPRNTGPVNLDLELNNLDTTGVKGFKLLSLKNDWKTLETKVFVPKLQGLGQYVVDGKVLLLPIVGKGNVNLTSDKVDLDFKLTFKRTKIGNKEHFQIAKMDVTIIPRRMYVYLTNLFNGDKTLGDSMNLFLDENWALLVEELRPPMESALSQTFTRIGNKVLAKIPANEIDIP